MLKLFKKKKPEVIKEEPKEKASVLDVPWSTARQRDNLNDYIEAKYHTLTAQHFVLNNTGATMDGAPVFDNCGINSDIIDTLSANDVSPQMLRWFASQGFIGYQACAQIAQQYLVGRACKMPAMDAVSRGYELSINEEGELTPQVVKKIRDLDKDFEIRKNLIEFIFMARVYGYRLALFLVESDDPHYYERPFNIDAITPKSYRGISQIDPQFVVPRLSTEASANPLSPDFYEPTWWQARGQTIHKSHFVIMRHMEVPDVLKPSYIYGGISLPQQIYERVYASERSANEAPQLLLSKRSNVLFTNKVEPAIANPALLEGKLSLWARLLDNWGTKVLGDEERFEQHDLSLTDLDQVIMSQYQLVASIAEIPAVKLLGTSPRGLNATGRFEEDSYHEMLKGLQTNALTPLLERHYQLLVRSEQLTIDGIDDFTVTPRWHELKTLSALELAELNLKKSQTAVNLMSIGAINGNDERNRLILDPDSGYDGMELEEEGEFEEPDETYEAELFLNEEKDSF